MLKGKDGHDPYIVPYQFLLDGKNLEDIMHHSTGIESLGAKEGAIGVFTQNRLNREQVLTQIVKALIGQYYYYQSQTNISLSTSHPDGTANT